MLNFCIPLNGYTNFIRKIFAHHARFFIQKAPDITGAKILYFITINNSFLQSSLHQMEKVFYVHPIPTSLFL